VAFPRTPVLIAQDGREPVLATANQAIFYNGCQGYRRELRHADGDRCSFVALSPSLAAELQERGELPFRFAHGPNGAAPFLVHALAVAHARPGQAEPLLIEDALHAVLRSVLAAALDAQAPPRSRRAATEAGHDALVEDAKHLLAARLDERIGLAELAAALHVSPFHLARVFRRRTGFSPHAYRLQLRLRVALERVLDGERDLALLACELGFVSHSHLTDSFRRSFGMPPSRLRTGGAQRRAELRTILEARLPAAA
jgi:methylphosphotriester-DNA--protein-cysteine methyltransferase